MNWFGKVSHKLGSLLRRPSPNLNPAVIAGEQPLVVFISSVMNDDLKWAREATAKSLDRVPYLHRWAFEYTPASSDSTVNSYLSKVREADIVIWLVGNSTTVPVRNEIREAISSGLRLWAFKLPATSRDAATEDLVKEVSAHVKWVEVASKEQLPELIDLTRGDEFVRAIRKRPGMGRIAHLEELARASRARCIARWQATGLSHLDAASLADDQAIGDPTSTLGTPLKEPVCVIAGEFGSGKSLVAERILQRSLREGIESISAPLPVFLRAREAIGHLQEKSAAICSEIGDPRTQGATIVIDGADEVGVDSVLELLAEARLLANTWPNTRIVVTTRPIGFPLAADELIRIEPLSEDSVDQIIERIIGRPVTGGERASWPDSIRSAINRPLFAVLMGIHLQEPHSHSPKSIAELLDWMIRASLGGHKETSGKIDEALQSIAVLSTSRTNSPIPAAEVSAIGPLQDLLNSRLVVSDGNLISFPLPIVTQWFAAKAILNKKVPIEQITSDRKLLESWYYPLVIALGLADHEQASSILKPLAKLHPSVAAMVADEALARSGMETDVKPPPFQESGRRIREAMQAWVDGIGPLKSLIAPLRQDGSLPPIGVAINDAWLDAGWYFGTEAIPDVVELPAAARPFGPGAPGWHFYRGARPGRQPSWAWRWALEKLRENLAEFVRKAALPISEGPLHHEKIWELVLVLAGKGSLHYQPVPLTKVEERITLFGTHGPKLILNGHRIDLDEMRGEIARLRHEGKTDFQPVWPSPNRNGGRWIWSGYTDQQVVARANAVFEGALNGYELLIQRWFPQLAPRMELAALLPVKVVGYVAMEHEEPHAAWHLEPLPKGSKSKAEFQLAPANQNPAIAHGETLKGIVPKVHALRPEIAEWYSYTYHHGGLEVFQVRSATELAYRWLESDLRRLSWIG